MTPGYEEVSERCWKSQVPDLWINVPAAEIAARTPQQTAPGDDLQVPRV